MSVVSSRPFEETGVSQLLWSPAISTQRSRVCSKRGVVTALHAFKGSHLRFS
jgi:hypothetical protein